MWPTALRSSCNSRCAEAPPNKAAAVGGRTIAVRRRVAAWRGRAKLKESGPLELRRQLAIVRARLPILILTVALTVAAALGWANLQTKSYSAEADLVVGQSLSGANPDYKQLLEAQRLASTYAFLATTRPVLDKVIAQLGLATTAEDLLAQVQVGTALDSSVLTVTARGPDPEQAARLAN